MMAAHPATQEEPVRHRIIRDIRRPDPSIIERYTQVSLPLVALQLGRSQKMDPRIKPVGNKNDVVVGPAVTLNLDSIDILMGYTVSSVIQPGDVIVVTAQGNTEVAVWGGSMTRSAENAGAAAVVIDGANEATWSLEQRKIPVYSRGSSLATGTNEKGGSINVPIACGNVCVMPGDLVLAGRDGVLVVPFDELEDVLVGAAEHWERVRASITWMNESGGIYYDYANLRERVDAAGVRWE
jgi:regulator of RNase E activity RraA